MKKEVIEIQVTGGAKGVQEVENINSSVNKVKQSSKDATKETEGLSTSAIAGAKNFKFMGVSINGVSKTLKLLKVSLIATGIGAIVVVVGSLAAAFLSTQAGVDALNSVLIPLKTVLATIWGVVQKLGEGLFQMVNGDISKGFDTMSKSVENLGGQLGDAWERGKELADLLIQIEERSVTQSLVLSRLNRHYAEQLEIAEDINKTEDERRIAFKNAIAAQETITKLKKADLDEQIRAIKIGEEDNDTNREAQKERNDLIAQREDIEASGLKARTLLIKKLNVVKGEAPEEQEKEKGEDRKKVLPLDAQLAQDQEIINTAASIKAAKERETGFALNTIREEIRQEDLDAETEIERQRVAVKQKALNDIISIAGAESKVGKALLIAKQLLQAKELVMEIAKTINFATQSASRSLVAVAEGTAQTAKIGFPQNIPMLIGYAAQAAGIFSAIKSAVSSAKASVSLPSVSSGGASATQAQAPQFNVVGTSGTNQLASAIGGQTQEPIKAYVVSNDVTTQQSLDRNIVDNATFG